MPARRSARSAAPAVRLSEDQIVRAALRLARKVGAENVSMRVLSAELRVSPMAIYYYVPNKGALLDLMVDAVLSQVPAPEVREGNDWQRELKASSLAAFELLAEYPGLSGVMLTRGNTRVGRAMVRKCIAMFLAAGFDERRAVLAMAAYNIYMIGVYAAINLAGRASAKPGRKKKKAGRPPADGLESGAVERLRALQVDQMIDFGIDAMISGITAIAAGESTPARKSRDRS